MFRMSDPLPGTATPTPPLQPPVPAGKPALDPAAQARRRVGRWLRYLSDIGAVLTTSLRDLARRRFEAGDDEPEDGVASDGKSAGIDLGLGRALIHRALRWIAALQDRFTAEARATKASKSPIERLLDPSGLDLEAAFRQLQAAERPKPIRYPPMRRDDCIDGKPTAEVVAQICADLDAAAEMMSEDRARRRIAAIADAARAFLGEPEAALLPPPAFPWGPPGEAPAAAESGVTPAAPTPDTG
jgi:hypothetical protein